MGAVSGFSLKITASADAVALAASYVAGKFLFFADSADNIIKYVGNDGVVHTFPSVASFNTRVGAIVPQVGDYSAFYQPLDTTLTNLAAQNWVLDNVPVGTGADTLSQLALGANTFLARSSSGNVAAKPITDAGLALVAAADAAAERTALGLGTAAQNNTGDFQPNDATLTALAGQNWVANSVPLGTGADTMSQLAIAANQFAARSSSGNVVAKSITDAGLAFAAAADAAAETALLNNATLALKGLLSTSNLQRLLGGSYDAVADFGFVGDLITTRGTTSVTGTAMTDSTNPFLPTDTGKRVTVPFAGAGSGVNAAQLTTTMTYVSANAVTLASGASNAVSNISVSYGTDNTAAINAMVTAVNAQTYPTAEVFFGGAQQTPTTTVGTGSYGWPVPAIFHKSVALVGQKRGYTSDAGDANKIGGTRLAWWGTSSDGGTAFQAMIEMSANDVYSLKAPRIQNLTIDCRNNDQNQALYGIKVASTHGMLIDSVYIMDALAAALWTNVSSTPSGDPSDTTRFTFSNVCIRQLDNSAQQAPMTTPIAMTSAVALTTTPQSLTVAANTLPTAGYFWTATNLGYPVLVRYTGGGGSTTLTGCTVAAEDVVNAPASRATGNVVQATPGNASAWIADGSATHNTCCGLVSMWQVSHGTTWGPAAIDQRNSDSIVFDQLMINGGNGAAAGTPLVNRITKPGVRCNGSATNNLLPARNNQFYSGDPGVGGISVMSLLDTGLLMAFPSGPHYWDEMQMGNAAPIPTCEFGTNGVRGMLDWTPNGGWRPGIINKPSVSSQTGIAGGNTNPIDGTLVVVPPQGFQVGTVITWTIPVSKTTAGTARVVSVHYGATGSSSDATVIATATLVSSAVADVGIMTITMVITALGSGTSATAIATYDCRHNSATAIGLGTNAIAMTMAGFNSTLPQSGPAFLHVEITSTAEVLTMIAPVYASCLHPGNP